MDVWFSIEEEPPPRGAKASWRDLKTFVCAPPKRIRRALALLTKTYHGCRYGSDPVGHRVDKYREVGFPIVIPRSGCDVKMCDAMRLSQD